MTVLSRCRPPRRSPAPSPQLTAVSRRAWFVVMLMLCAGALLAAERTTIAGVVVDGRGRPVSAVRIRVTRGTERATASTDANGRSSLPVNGSGQYQLEATDGRIARIRRVVVVRSREKVSLRLVLPSERIIGGAEVAPPPPVPPPPK